MVNSSLSGTCFSKQSSIVNHPNRRKRYQRDPSAPDTHHASPMMAKIAELRDKYGLHMRVERYITDEGGVSAADQKFIKK